MRLRIENVGKVNTAEIEMDGITVIAGYNNTGKTTILRSADLMLKTYHNLDKNISEERVKSILTSISRQDTLFDENGLEDMPYQLLLDISNEIEPEIRSNGNHLIRWKKYFDIFSKNIDAYKNDMEDRRCEEKSEYIAREIYLKLKEVDERKSSVYEKYLAEINLRNEFCQQAHNLINGNESRLVLSNDVGKCTIKFHTNKITEESGFDLGEAPVIYIETRNILDDMSRQIGNSASRDLRKMLLRKRNFNRDEISYEQYQETERNIDTIEQIFKEVIKGRLFAEGGLLKYKEDSIEESINVKNAASGMKVFLLLYKLIENGSLKENSWILIDEPESNLHPDWHLKLAEILILLKMRMNIHILLSSHSPYFMRALEVKLVDYGIKSSGRFYLMEDANGMYTARNVTECTEEIYKQLYRPLESL